MSRAASPTVSLEISPFLIVRFAYQSGSLFNHKTLILIYAWKLLNASLPKILKLANFFTWLPFSTLNKSKRLLIIYYIKTYLNVLYITIKLQTVNFDEFSRRIQVEMCSNKLGADWYPSYRSQMQKLLALMLLQTSHFSRATWFPTIHFQQYFAFVCLYELTWHGLLWWQWCFHQDMHTHSWPN